jgi:hypothetical protein
MAIKSFSQLVTTTRAALNIQDTDNTDGCQVWLYGEYHGSSNKVAIGGADVTLANGIHIYGGEKFGPINLGHGEQIHVISDSATGIDLRVLLRGA